MGKSKRPPVMRNKHASGHAARQKEREALREDIVRDWTAQMCLDVMGMVLNDEFGFGKDRLTRLGQLFNEAFDTCVDGLRLSPEADYIRAKVDERLRQIYGPDVLPWDQRYRYWPSDLTLRQ